jgi:hypothetical protein
MHAIEWIILIVVIAGAIIAILGLDRYRRNPKADTDATPTDEVFVDQDTGRRMRVWYNPKTGAREYRPE